MWVKGCFNPISSATTLATRLHGVAVQYVERSRVLTLVMNLGPHAPNKAKQRDNTMYCIQPFNISAT